MPAKGVDGPVLGLKGIARLAGVSPATVSRVINHRPGVRAELRQSVEAIIREHGLHVDVAARALKTRKTRTLAIIIPRAGEFVFQNPYYTEILRGITSVTEQAAYSLSLITAATPLTLHEVNRNRSCDAALFIGIRKNIPDMQSLRGAVVPVVTIPRPGPRYGLPYVSMDDETGAYSATRHLIERGHRRIGIVVGLSNSLFTINRLPGYRRALTEAGIQFDTSLVQDGQFTYEGGREAGSRLIDMEDRPTAIFAISDLMALGVIFELKSKGLAIPGDVAVVGFGNTPACEYSTPSLTSVDEQLHALGTEAATLLIQLAQGQTPAREQVLLSTSLVVRETS